MNVLRHSANGCRIEDLHLLKIYFVTLFKKKKKSLRDIEFDIECTCAINEFGLLINWSN